MRLPSHDPLVREVPLNPILSLRQRRSEASLGLVTDQVNVPRSFGTGSTPHPYFTPLTEKVWGKSGISFRWGHCPWVLWNGEYPLTPIFYPFDREGSGASLGLVLDEFTVPGCFGTNRKTYKCHPRPVTWLYILGCVLSANICFRNGKDHGKRSKLLGLVTPRTTRIYSNYRYSPTC